jgi:hypothetical protein
VSVEEEEEGKMSVEEEEEGEMSVEEKDEGKGSAEEEEKEEERKGSVQEDEELVVSVQEEKGEVLVQEEPEGKVSEDEDGDVTMQQDKDVSEEVDKQEDEDMAEQEKDGDSSSDENTMDIDPVQSPPPVQPQRSGCARNPPQNLDGSPDIVTPQKQTKTMRQPKEKAEQNTTMPTIFLLLDVSVPMSDSHKKLTYCSPIMRMRHQGCHL